MILKHFNRSSSSLLYIFFLADDFIPHSLLFDTFAPARWGQNRFEAPLLAGSEKEVQAEKNIPITARRKGPTEPVSTMNESAAPAHA